jgi:hypothetical protein
MRKNILTATIAYIIYVTELSEFVCIILLYCSSVNIIYCTMLVDVGDVVGDGVDV